MVLKLMDRSYLRSTHGRQINGGMQVAAGASNLEIPEPGIESIPSVGEGLSGPAKAKHALRQAVHASLSASTRASRAL
jgi:hypothetical protein